jgi:hypothetical protein
VILGDLAARMAKDEAAAKEFLGPIAKRLDASAWPYPVVQFLRGEIDEAKLLALAVDTDMQTDAHGYLGLYHELAGRKAEALVHYRWVKEHGTKWYLSHEIALAGMARLEL